MRQGKKGGPWKVRGHKDMVKFLGVTPSWDTGSLPYPRVSYSASCCLSPACGECEETYIYGHVMCKVLLAEPWRVGWGTVTSSPVAKRWQHMWGHLLLPHQSLMSPLLGSHSFQSPVFLLSTDLWLFDSPNTFLSRVLQFYSINPCWLLCYTHCPVCLFLLSVLLHWGQPQKLFQCVY